MLFQLKSSIATLMLLAGTGLDIAAPDLSASESGLPSRDLNTTDTLSPDLPPLGFDDGLIFADDGADRMIALIQTAELVITQEPTSDIQPRPLSIDFLLAEAARHPAQPWPQEPTLSSGAPREETVLETVLETEKTGIWEIDTHGAPDQY